MNAPLNPAPLIELATAYWGSATLVAAVRLKLFTHLAAGPAPSSMVAERASTDPVATDALLAALASLRLVQKDGEGRFANTPLADTFLVEGRPGYLGPAMLYNGDIYPLWGELDGVVRSGDVRRAPDQYLGDDAERTRNFVHGMHHRALGVGRAVAQVIDLTGRTRLADVGGGPGTYSALLCQQTPGLQAEVLDLPGVVAIAREIVADLGVADRVKCTAFDYYRDALPGRYDAALVSGVLHREQPAQVQAILGAVAEALEPGGVLYLSDVMLDDDRAGPTFATMFALNMRVLAHDGRCHTVAESRAWLDAAGFDLTDVTRLPAPIHYTVLRAERRR
ncbi:MAG: SAM-dependent methyltransferase [Myxococcales bacterium]|nr:SAM-dependent methyltransferase [Myxococcales bacterium]